MNVRCIALAPVAIVALAAALCLSTVAGAQPAPSPPDASAPWARGVAPDQRERGRALAREALALHKQLLRQQAVDTYQRALAHWEHPAFRWNLVLLYRDMGQYLRAHESLERVLAWSEGFDAERLRRYQDLREELFAKHLAVIEVESAEPGASISLDGKEWFTGPGQQRQVVLPGEHAIIASKPGFFSVVKRVTVPAGKRAEVTLEMDEDGIFTTRRFASYLPWASLGAGAAVTLLGGGLRWQANRDFAAAEQDFTDACELQPPCAPNKPETYDRAVTGNRLAVAAFVVGGAALAAGAVLLFVNRERAFRTEQRDRSRFRVVPLLSADQSGGISGDTVGLSADFRF